MAQSILELRSSHGDQGLARLRFVLHGSSTAEETAAIQGDGLRFTEGQSVVSTSLGQAYDWTHTRASGKAGGAREAETAQLGRVLVLAVPPDLRVGSGVFTTAFVDRKRKQVSGAPMRYAAGRTQVALYAANSPDNDVVRQRVESEIESGRSLEQHDQLTVAPQYLVGSFEKSELIPAFLYQLDRLLATLQPLDIGGLSEMLRETFRVSQPAQTVQVPVAMKDIIIGTTESKLMLRLRMMRWRGLATMGYKFFEGRDAVEIEPLKDISEQQRRIDQLEREVAGSGLFVGELVWLKTYVLQELAVMKIELDGANLE